MKARLIARHRFARGSAFWACALLRIRARDAQPRRAGRIVWTVIGRTPFAELSMTSTKLGAALHSLQDALDGAGEVAAAAITRAAGSSA